MILSLDIWGGDSINPSYEEVCKGNTNHAEVVQVAYNPKEVSFKDLLTTFWDNHNPTTLNRQGNDIGTQYRSVVFFHDDSQKEKTIFYKNKLIENAVWDSKIVTEISPISNFFPAESYHQDYFLNNPQNGYCQAIVRPKFEKFKKSGPTSDEIIMRLSSSISFVFEFLQLSIRLSRN